MAYALSVLGRVSLLRKDLDAAATQLDVSIALAEGEHWLAFVPWPQSMRGEVQLARGDLAGAEETCCARRRASLSTRGPPLGGISARGLALLAEASGETSRAFELLADPGTRCNRLADAYVWLDGYIIDAQCNLGVQHGHPDTARWVDTMCRLTSRTAM